MKIFKDKKRKNNDDWLKTIFPTKNSKVTKIFCDYLRNQRDNLITTKETKGNKSFMSGAYAAGKYIYYKRNKR